MEKQNDNQVITVKTTVNKPVDQVWELWTDPRHVVQWNNASAEWYTPKATNDLRVSGAFNYTMAARDGSASFDFEGIYKNIILHRLIEYDIIDGRKVKIIFTGAGNVTEVVETFETETENSAELQRQGWQAILDSFKTYAESQNG